MGAMTAEDVVVVSELRTGAHRNGFLADSEMQ
jgi:hypothetical protein